MFFKRKNQDDLYRRLEGQFTALSQDTAAISQKLEVLNDLNRNLDQFGYHTSQTISQMENSMNQNLSRLESHFSQLHSDVHKHDMAIEDLLDEWAEKKSDEDDTAARLRESAQTEKVLLELFEAYQEQFWNLKHYADSKDESLTAQVALMEKNLEHYRRTCAISVIQECGVSVDYDLHDVIEAVDTADPALDKTIAEIYRCGYLYKGKVRKKAQAAAYRLSNT